MLQFLLVMPKEADRGGFDQQGPLHPSELPEELAGFLRTQEYSMLTQASDQGTIFVVKAPQREIRSVTGPVLMRLSHELYQEPQAPVIRSIFEIYEQPPNPLSFETFTNVRDEQH